MFLVQFSAMSSLRFYVQFSNSIMHCFLPLRSYLAVSSYDQVHKVFDASFVLPILIFHPV